jgi:hypothetical protein
VSPSTPSAGLVAIDGLGTASVKQAAKAFAASHKHLSPGVSFAGASGIFDDLKGAGVETMQASARTLLLLYAADLAFRLRWEILPALAESRVVIAAPYVDTAIAVGRAAGLDPAWLRGLFTFAPRPRERRVATLARTGGTERGELIDFVWHSLVGTPSALTKAQLVQAARTHLKPTRPVRTKTVPPRTIQARAIKKSPAKRK